MRIKNMYDEIEFEVLKNLRAAKKEESWKLLLFSDTNS